MTNSYYSTSWQVLEDDIVLGSTTTKDTYVWSLSYIDDIVARDQSVNGGAATRIYAQQDANHDVTALVNTGGSVLERFDYDPYGTATVLSASWGGTTDAYSWLYLFQGGRYDSSVKNYNFRTRDYRPTLGTWMESDFAGYADGPNLYQFVAGNPLKYADPLGLRHVDIHIFIDKAGVSRTFDIGKVEADLNNLLKACKCKNAGDSFDVILGFVSVKPHPPRGKFGMQGLGDLDDYDGYLFANNSASYYAYTNKGETEFNWQKLEQDTRANAQTDGVRNIDWAQTWANFIAHEQAHLGVIDSHDYGNNGEITAGKPDYNTPAKIPPGWCKKFLKALGITPP